MSYRRVCSDALLICNGSIRFQEDAVRFTVSHATQVGTGVRCERFGVAGTVFGAGAKILFLVDLSFPNQRILGRDSDGGAAAQLDEI